MRQLPGIDESVELVGQQAARWWVLQRSGELAQREQAEFLDWLRQSPVHVRAYLEVATADRELREAARACPDSAEDLLVHGTSVATLVSLPPMAMPVAESHALEATHPRRLRRRFLVAAGLALVLTVAFSTDWWLAKTGWPVERVFETAHGEQGSFPLPDGSVLHLNSDSRAVLAFSRGQRLIRVDRGQAMFKVAKDPNRPFQVTAGDTHVVALGTQFDVYRRPGRTDVVVLEGRVAVIRGPMPAVNRKTLDLPRSVPVDAGQRTSARADTPLVVESADLRQARAWLQREIVFDATPVREVVADFNRYSSIPIVVEGDALGRLEITGVFGAYDLESFLQFISRVQGVRVEKEPGLIRLVEQPVIRRGPVIARGEGQVMSSTIR